MRKYEMIKDSDYFSSIIKTGSFTKDKNFVIYFKKNNNNYSNFGIAIKKSIGSAVIRNKLKRRVRSIVDNNRKLFKNEMDYIIMIRDGCKSTSFEDLNKSINDLMKGKNK